MKPTAWIVLMFGGVLFLTGCTSVSPEPGMPRLRPGRPKAEAGVGAQTNLSALHGQWHDVVIEPRPDCPEISTCQKLNPIWWFGNVDEPRPPGWYRPNKKFRTFTWYLRNPLHNFDTYVIGLTDKEHVRSGRYPERIGNPNGGWNYAVAKHRRLRLPMISYSGRRVDFYFGWRVSGGFGIKFNVNSAEKAKP